MTNILADQVLSWFNNRNKEKPFFLMWNPKTPHRPWKPDTAYLDMYDNINIPEPKTPCLIITKHVVEQQKSRK